MGSSVLKQTSAWLLFLLVIAMLPLLAPAQATPAPSPGLDCLPALEGLLPCLTFVQGNVSTPPKNCCVALSGVVNSDAICLCSLFSANNSFGIVINITDALKLPVLCKVSTPPASDCSAAGYPVPSSLTSPSVSPSAKPPSPSSTPPTSSAPSSGVPVPSPTSAASTPGPTTPSPSPLTGTPPGSSPGSSAPSSGATPSANATSPPPPSTPGPSPSATGELSVSTAMCFVALLVASLQLMKL